MKIFLDANILFSAAYTDGAIRALLKMIREEGHVCWIDSVATEEATRNIHIHRPRALQDLEQVIRTCTHSTSLPTYPAQLDIVDLPESDRHILLAAISLRCDRLLTGDKKHFGSLYNRTIHGVTITSPLQLHKVLQKGR
ncbi:MAG: hypothetical protein EHM43_06805 [Ignavibacteriae bacterium]|nr:MAG: hypothetical protein EHM43_06805 [Ignavibacteriota bacterium]